MILKGKSFVWVFWISLVHRFCAAIQKGGTGLKNRTKLLMLLFLLIASAAVLYYYMYAIRDGRMYDYFMRRGLLLPFASVLIQYALIFITMCFSEYRKRAISIVFACLYIAFLIFSLRNPLFYQRELINTCFIYKYLPYLIDLILIIPYIILSPKHKNHFFSITFMVVILLMLAYLAVYRDETILRYYSDYYILAYELLGVFSIFVRYLPSDRTPRHRTPRQGKVYTSGHPYLDEYKRKMRGQS